MAKSAIRKRKHPKRPFTGKQHQLTTEDRQRGGEAKSGRPELRTAAERKREAKAQEVATAASTDAALKQSLYAKVENILGYLPKDFEKRAMDPLGLRREIKQALALQLRKQGKTHLYIANELGVSEQEAWELVNEAIVALKAYRISVGDDLREIANQRLELIIERMMVNVLLGEDKAANAVTKAIERQAKLYGLDAPTGVRFLDGGKSGDYTEMSDTELDLAEKQTMQNMARLKSALARLLDEKTETINADTEIADASRAKAH